MRWGNGKPDSAKAGMKARVAEAMAEGDTIKRYPLSGAIEAVPAKPAEISAKLGISAVYVRSVQARIRADLGPQAIADDLGWRG